MSGWYSVVFLAFWITIWSVLFNSFEKLKTPNHLHWKLNLKVIEKYLTKPICRSSTPAQDHCLLSILLIPDKFLDNGRKCSWHIVHDHGCIYSYIFVMQSLEPSLLSGSRSLMNQKMSRPGGIVKTSEIHVENLG